MRGALTGTVSEVHRNYHIPISNTAAATLVFENVPAVARKDATSAKRAPVKETV
jgi:protocatechuate 4,5-dioxygenase beta chain